MKRLLTRRLQLPELPPHVVLTITLVFAALTLVRGADWALGGKPGTVSDLMLANGVGLRFWGTMLAGGALGLFTAYAARGHFAVWSAHTFLVCVYFGIVITTTQTVLLYRGGYQNLAAPLGGFIWHALISRVMRPAPPRDGGRHDD